MIDSILSDSDYVHEIIDKLGVSVPDHPQTPPRPRIPIRVE